MGVWEGNAIKVGCDDSCTTINVIKLILKKKKKKKKRNSYSSDLPPSLGTSICGGCGPENTKKKKKKRKERNRQII